MFSIGKGRLELYYRNEYNDSISGKCTLRQAIITTIVIITVLSVVEVVLVRDPSDFFAKLMSLVLPDLFSSMHALLIGEMGLIFP